jgi:hypothetical protein
VRTRALAVLLAVTTLALGACGGDDREATPTVEQLSPLTEGAEKAAIAPDTPVGVVPDRSLGKTFYVLRIHNQSALPHVWGDLRETPDVPAHAKNHTPGIERDGPIWRYAVAPGNGASITFFTPLDER